MRIGLLPGATHLIGGAYQYGLSMIEALDPTELAAQGDELVLLAHPGTEVDLAAAGAAGWRVERATPRKGPRALAAAVARRMLRRPPRVPQQARFDRDLHRQLRKLGIELMLYPVPSFECFEARVPYVLAVHDLQHRLQPEFPEVSAGGQTEWREYLFRNAIENALVVLVDSETGKEDVLACYEGLIEPDQIRVLPFVPPRSLADPVEDDPADVRRRYGLSTPYVFYPARFWPHKNHRAIVEALGLLAARNVDVDVVFAGSGTGAIVEETHAEVLARAAQLGVVTRVHDLGYVPDEDVAALYRGAIALVMPTFFGPTNIPVVEAWALGCPVLTSDIRGIREHVGDAAVLADPRSPDAIADGIQRLVESDDLRRELAANGRARLALHGPSQFRERLHAAVADAKLRVRAAA